MAEKKNIFAKIAKGLLIGGGTVLSLINPAIGAPLIVAGGNINTGGSVDKLGAYAGNLETARTQVLGMQTGAAVVTTWDKIRANPLPYIAGGIGLLFLLKTFKIIK